MRYLITGGAGSLGRALTRKINQSPDSEVVVYSRDEGKHAEYFPRGSGVSTVIGDVRDFDRLNITVKRHRPDCIIHAAALKRIDDIELQPEESIKTNVNGTENVARAALLNDVGKCMFISTDKACKPVNVYGSSKFIAERIFTNYDFNSANTVFSSVRYGNVISSRGSFIPTWMNLINSGKSINVTSLEMTRFMFTLNDAVTAVLEGIDNSSGGEVFVPKIDSFDMRTILLAIENLVGKKINYNVTGLRPGEKLHEAVSYTHLTLPTICSV